MPQPIDPSSPEISALLTEERTFPPSAAFTAAAHANDPGVYARAAADPEAFWAGFANELEWITPFTRVLEWDVAGREVVRRRPAERRRQLPRSPRPHGAPQQGRDHLGRRARRPPHAHLLRSLPRRERVRARAARARREEGRPRRALHAADPRAGHRDAGLRPPRRRAQRRLRRLQLRVAARSHQRLAVHGAGHRRRRLSPRPARAAQADGRRGAEGHAVDPPRRRRPARSDGALPGAHPGGPRPLVPPADAGSRTPARRARADGRRGHALHPLHVRHDREAEGHRPHHRRLSGRLLRHHQVGLRHEGRRRLLVHGRHRLGDRPQLRRLRPARQRRHRRDVRRRARLAGQGALLADRRALRRDDLLHRADRHPRLHALGHRASGDVRSLEPARCSDRWASRSTPRRGCGTTRPSAASAARSSTRGGRPRPATS